MSLKRRIVLGCVFLFAFAMRWLTLGGLGGDDHWSLWSAATFLKGDRPFRDFVDAGDPLYWGLSALAQWIVGYRVIGEVVLGSALIAFAVAVSTNLVWQATRSIIIACISTSMVVLLITITELYSYPKILVYPLGMWLGWRYIDRRTLWRFFALALGVVIAFGYRHDHGAYVGIGAAAAVLAAHWPEGPRAAALGIGRLTCAVLLLLSPYLVVVQAHEGIVAYFRERIRFAAQLDRAGRRAVPFTVDSTAPDYWLAIRPPAPARVVVVWEPDVTADTRKELERRYSLTNGVDPTTGMLEYTLSDVSQANLSALMREPRAAQIQGISGSYRARYRMRSPEPGGAAVLVQWSPSLADARRSELEQQYQLINRRPNASDPSGRTSLYTVHDTSEPNITALIDDPAVERVDGFDVESVPRVFQLTEAAADGRSAQVSLDWKDDVPTAERVSLEQRYRLVLIPNPKWDYLLADTSRDNIRSLLNDAHVLDTALLDDKTFRPREESWWIALSRQIPLLRLRVAPRYLHRENAGVFLYYVSLTLPYAVFLLLLADRWRARAVSVMPLESAKMFAAAVMMAVATAALLRKLGYVADHADATTVLGAWLLGRALVRRRRDETGAASSRLAVRRVGGASVAVAVLAALATMAATFSYGEAATLWSRAGADRGLAGLRETNLRKVKSYTASPPIADYAPPGVTGDRALLRYLYDCTRPDDRIWVTSDVYTIPYYTERRVVRHIFWAMGFQASPADQRRTIAMLERDPVPIIVGVGGARPLQYFEAYGMVRQYVSQRYREHHALLQDQLEGQVIWLLIDSRRRPTGSYEPLALPCFK